MIQHENGDWYVFLEDYFLQFIPDAGEIYGFRRPYVRQDMNEWEILQAGDLLENYEQEVRRNNEIWDEMNEAHLQLITGK